MLCIFVECFDSIFRSNIGLCRIEIVSIFILTFSKLRHGWVVNDLSNWVMNHPYFLIELYQNWLISLDILKKRVFM